MKEVQEAYEGEWWLPSESPRKIGGILELGDKFELRLWDSIADEGLPALGNRPDSNILHGRSLGKALTLFDAQTRATKTVLGGGGSVARIHAPLVLVGSYWPENAEEARFDRVHGAFGNLIEWADQPAISRTVHEDGRRTLERRPLDTLSAFIEGATVKLGHGYSATNGRYVVRWEQTTELTFELSKSDDVREIDYRFLRPFRYLLNLATSAQSPPGPFRVARMTGADSSDLMWLDVCAYGRHDHGATKSVMPQDMLFTLKSIDFSSIIPRWYQLVEKLGITCDLLFTLESPNVPFVGNQLFNVASAAEGIHQRLYPEADEKTPEHRQRINEILEATPEAHRDWLGSTLQFSHRLTFAQRLDQLIDHAGPAVYPFVGDREKWVRLVKRMRNQIAHALRERYALETDVIKLARLTATVDALLRMVLLREIGFSEDECVAMVDRNPRWRFLRNVLPTELPEIF